MKATNPDFALDLTHFKSRIIWSQVRRWNGDGPFVALQSHAVGEAHWDGRCLLSEEEQQVYLFRNIVPMDDDELVAAMEDLATTNS